MHSIMEITLQEISDSVRLARDVCDANGCCLLAEGALLTVDGCDLLRRRGVSAVFIEVENTQTSAQLEQARARIHAELMQRFPATGDDAAQLKLRDMLLAYRLSALK